MGETTALKDSRARSLLSMSSLSKVPIQGPDKLLYLFRTRTIQWKEMRFFLSWTPTLLWSLPRLDFLSQWKSQPAHRAGMGAWHSQWAGCGNNGSEQPSCFLSLESWQLLGGGEVKISSHWFGSKYGFRSSNYHIILLARNYACPLQHLPSLFRKIKRGKIKILKHLKCSYLRWWHTTQLPASQVLQPCANNDSQHSHYTVSLIYVFSPSRPGCQKEGEEEG